MQCHDGSPSGIRSPRFNPHRPPAVVATCTESAELGELHWTFQSPSTARGRCNSIARCQRTIARSFNPHRPPTVDATSRSVGAGRAQSPLTDCGRWAALRANSMTVSRQGFNPHRPQAVNASSPRQTRPQDIWASSPAHQAVDATAGFTRSQARRPVSIPIVHCGTMQLRPPARHPTRVIAVSIPIVHCGTMQLRPPARHPTRVIAVSIPLAGSARCNDPSGDLPAACVFVSTPTGSRCPENTIPRPATFGHQRAGRPGPTARIQIGPAHSHPSACRTPIRYTESGRGETHALTLELPRTRLRAPQALPDAWRRAQAAP